MPQPVPENQVVGLQPSQIVGVAHRLAGRRDVFDRDPVERVIVEPEDSPVALPQRARLPLGS